MSRHRRRLRVRSRILKTSALPDFAKSEPWSTAAVDLFVSFILTSRRAGGTWT